MSLNKCAIVIGPAEGKDKAKRPALEMLNLLNSRLVEENHAAQYRQQVEALKEENQQLRIANDQLEKQLQVEKRLRKAWNREEAVIFEDVEAVRRELQAIKARYHCN